MPRVDPYKNHRFLIEVDGITEAGFSECSGLGSQLQVVEYREGGDPDHVRKLPGQTTYPDISLKWGVADTAANRDLYNWHLAAIQGAIERKNGSVILLDSQGQEKVRWNFFNAWPSQYEAPSFNSTANEVAIDTLTLSCERLERLQE